MLQYTSGKLTNLSVGYTDEPFIYKFICFGVSGLSLHDVALSFFISQGDGRYLGENKIKRAHHVSSQVDTEDGDGSQGQRDVGADEEEEGDDGGKVVVQQDHVGGLLGDVRPRDAHSDTDVSLLQSRRVVHTVTCHSHNGSLQREERSVSVSRCMYLKALNPDLREVLAKTISVWYFSTSSSNSGVISFSSPPCTTQALASLQRKSQQH
ncbi:hypothetical protein F7725_009302 [Dissostichus mawsoni]|uniref:Uncharacterized protein n=1 Tax=Dissostichus mawsoni TaxID=36200 RepID=A0A7J5Z7F1_DISMA|nr:hypothetical protein F7725_009302 [Dissostichus mawsoni]